MSKKAFNKMISEMNEETRISRERFLRACSIDELVNALKQKTDKVEEIEIGGNFDFSVDTFGGNYSRSGPATILVVDES
jgi:hypothetical protein